MTLDSPILALCALPAAAVAVGAAGRWMAAWPRWLLRAGATCALAAVGGPSLQCDRPLNIAVMIDVSPSTRGAAFRDPLSVTTRLTPLLDGRPYTLHYFADGEQPSAVEPPAARTRLDAQAGADAIVLLSDGRFEAAADLPPVYAVIDPTLNSPADARVREIRLRDAAPANAGDAAASTETSAASERGKSVHVDVVSVAGRALALQGAAPPAHRPPAGPTVVNAQAIGGPVAARFEGGDLWPENDALAIEPNRPPVRRLAIDVALPTFEAAAARTLPVDAAAYLGVAVVAMAAPAELSPAQVEALADYVRQLGGTLLLVGPPQGASPPLRALAPLTAVPPAGPQAWTILLDGSGSMAAADGETTRWARAIAAAKRAVERLPGGARVTVLRFASDLRVVADNADSAGAGRALDAVADDAPSGRTGLRAALESVARRPAEGGRRVLLLTDGDADLGETTSLRQTLVNGGVTVSAVTTTASLGLADVCAATGGRIAATVAPADWARALGGLAAIDLPPVDRAESWQGRDLLHGMRFTSTARTPAFAKDGVTLIAGDDATPAAAVWSVGLGRVASLVARTAPDVTGAIAHAVERPAVDNRFVVAFDAAGEVVRLLATDAGGPMNGMTPVLTRAGQATPFVAAGPGAYVAPLSRLADATLAMVTVGGAVVAQQAVAGRYAAEFDVIGNDRAALDALATRTGGAVIEAGDHGPIAFAREVDTLRLRGWLTGVSALLLVAGVATGRRRGA